MPTFDYDLFVIGAGSGGVRVSRASAALGARVGIAEAGPLGGTCVNVGCVPKKLTYYAAQYADDLKQAVGYGWKIPAAHFDWAAFVAKRTAEVERLNRVYRRLLDDGGVALQQGRAHLLDAHTVEVAGKAVTAEHIVVASGSRPFLPDDIPGIELVDTSDDVFEYTSLPRRLVVTGAGYIGVEFASMFTSLGVDVTLIYRGDKVLRGFDEDVRKTLGEALADRGLKFRFNRTIARIERAAQPSSTGTDELRLVLDDHSELLTDRLVCAVGRWPNTANLGLEQAGVALADKGAIAVDDFSRSSVSGVWAIGDCTNRINLTPVAIAEGQAVAQTIFGGKPTRADHSKVATAVFSHPCVGAVGLTETQARQSYGDVAVFRSHFKPLKHALTGHSSRSLFKVIVDRVTDRVLGCHLLGDEAPELIQCLAVALRCGLTKAQLDATIAVHPTSAEELVLMRQERS